MGKYLQSSDTSSSSGSESDSDDDHTGLTAPQSAVRRGGRTSGKKASNGTESTDNSDKPLFQLMSEREERNRDSAHRGGRNITASGARMARER